jgi:hypothetical protein
MPSDSNTTGWRETWRLLSRGAKLGGRDLGRLSFWVAAMMVANASIALIEGIVPALILPAALVVFGGICWFADRRAEMVEALTAWAAKND